MLRMRRVFAAAALAALVALGLSPAPGGADPVAHLAWDDCGSAGVVTRTFACNSNAGTEQLIVSFVPPAGISAFGGLELRIQLMDENYDLASLPAWWRMLTGGCRPTSLSAQVRPAGQSGCANPWADGAIGATSMSSTAPGVIRAVAANLPGSELPLDPALEYYGLRIQINHARSTGDGVCVGCSTAIGMALSYLKLSQPPGTGDYTYNFFTYDSMCRFIGAPPPYVNWQCEGTPILQADRDPCHLAGWVFPNCATPTQQPTWGKIKALYR